MMASPFVSADTRSPMLVDALILAPAPPSPVSSVPWLHLCPSRASAAPGQVGLLGDSLAFIHPTACLFSKHP